MELFVEKEQRLGLPLALGKDAMDAVRRAFPGQEFAIDAVKRAFGRPDPAEGCQQTVLLQRTAEGTADGTSEKRVDSENAGPSSGTPPALADVAAVGWERRMRRGSIPDERELAADRVSALEKALTGFAERETDAVVNPTVGTCFDSLAEAYDFCNLYSWELGFGIRYGKSRTNAKGSKSMQEIVCGRAGKPEKNSRSCRCDCTALIRLLRTNDNGWYVSRHTIGHNHAFSKTCAEKSHWPSHRHIDKYTKDLVRQLRENKVNLNVYSTIASYFGRMENFPFTKRSIRTLYGKISREQADDDVRENMEASAALGEKDPDYHTLEETPFNCCGVTSITLDSVNMPVDPLRHLEQDDTQRNAEAGRLADLMSAFGDSHLVLQSCTYDDLINSNGTMSDLEEAVNAVMPHLQQGIFGDLWSRAHHSGGVVSAPVLTIRDLFRFKRWLTTTTGQHNLQTVQQRIKLVKNGKGVFEPEQIALIRLFQAQNDERSHEISKMQGERDAKIACNKAKMDKARATFEARVEAAKVEYPVSASYVPLDTNELRRQCWTAYLAHCQKEAKELNPKASNIVEKFGSEVQQRHLLEFCSQEANRQALLKYGQTKIKKLKEAGVTRGENTFRGYMALLNIEQAYVLLAAEAQVADDADTSQGGEDEDHSDRHNDAVRDEAAGGDGEEDGGGDTLEAPPRQKRRRHS